MTLCDIYSEREVRVQELYLIWSMFPKKKTYKHVYSKTYDKLHTLHFYDPPRPLIPKLVCLLCGIHLLVLLGGNFQQHHFKIESINCVQRCPSMCRVEIILLL